MPSACGSDQAGASEGCQRNGPSVASSGRADVGRRLHDPPIVAEFQFLGQRLQPLEHRLIEVGFAGEHAELGEFGGRLGFLPCRGKHCNISCERIDFAGSRVDGRLGELLCLNLIAEAQIQLGQMVATQSARVFQFIELGSSRRNVFGGDRDVSPHGGDGQFERFDLWRVRFKRLGHPLRDFFVALVLSMGFRLGLVGRLVAGSPLLLEQCLERRQLAAGLVRPAQFSQAPRRACGLAALYRLACRAAANR